ncbi:MAG TPA: hypothetical protein VGG87_01595 [Solirubrobacteraceae bacterium]
MGPRALSLTLCAVALTGAALSAGCGTTERRGGDAGSEQNATAPPALVREARPIGREPRFHPPVRGPVVGACRPRLGVRHGVHVEIFAANRVVLVAAGLGTKPPLQRSEGRIVAARCYGSLVTVEPTGVVLVRPRAGLTLAAVFRSWGQPLSRTRLASFAAGRGRRVEVFVGGRRWLGGPGAVPLRAHAEIVLEVGPHVPPHSHYTFPPGV